MSLLSRLAVQAARAYGILSSADKTKVVADYLVVAGGGGGGGSQGGGGGAGGLLTSTFTLSTLNTYSIAVGAGGNGGANVNGTSGSNSSVSGTGLSTVTSTGGGRGGGEANAGASGGSGGGGGAQGGSGAGGSPTSGQGFAGGSGSNPNAGGGGGAGEAGNTDGQRHGGDGVASSISGSSVTYAGGGSGGSNNGSSVTGGDGGGGTGTGNTTAGTAGTVNTGGGGGGGGSTAGVGNGAGGAGGSGIVIISYTSATPKFVGGTLTTSGGKQIHTFTSSGTLSPITPITASYLVVAGGGSGGYNYGGGGGAGGLLTGSTTLYSGATYVVTVGAGGPTDTTSSGTNGSNSSLLGTGLTTITSTGGGKGARTNGAAASSGGSGGGGCTNGNETGASGTPGQGFAGGTTSGTSSPGSGGGGSGSVGGNATGGTSGNGGTGGSGTASSISGSSVTYAGGGGGGSVSGTAGTASGGGGAGATGSGVAASSGTPNLGGGGGGGSGTNGNGGAGGSGVVIISYAGSQAFNGGLVTSSGGNTIHTFTSTGALTPLTNNLTNSLRFRKSASAYLSRTPTATGSQQKFTLSTWVKLGDFTTGADSFIWASADNAAAAVNPSLLWKTFSGTYTFIFDLGTGGVLTTTQVFRDPSAWYHVVINADTTQATAADRMKMYINGNQVTAFSSATYPTQNTNILINTPSYTARLGGVLISGSTVRFFDGYMADVNFVDGQALEPYYFGNNDANGVWKPILYKGTYGTNGFYLTFGNTTSTTTLGYDSSPNGNNWTTNNISLTAGTTYDAMTDVPTNTSATTANYCVLNPLALSGNSLLTNANLNFASSSGSSYGTACGTIGFLTGKYYWEVTLSSANQVVIGVSSVPQYANAYLGSDAFGWSYISNTGSKANNGVSAYAASATTGDVIGVTMDADAGTLTFYKNGVSLGTAFSGMPLQTYFPAVSNFYSNQLYINFGQRPFSYTPPTGFVALNTFNLPTPTILQGNKYMDATLYTGNGSSSQVIVNNTQFKPDLVWVKSRSTANENGVYDTVRGANKGLFTNRTNAEDTSTIIVTALNSNGFTVGSDGIVNTNAATYVGWQWQAGQGSTSSNTSGSITSTVSVNTTAGFSVVTYTGTGTAATVGHGLGVAPKMLIVKNRVQGTYGNWNVWHTTLTGSQYLTLNAQDAAGTNNNRWNGTVPTSTVFSVGTDSFGNTNKSGDTYVAYCWAEIAGFSKFGSYTGNGSTDGPFVYTGFRPKFIMFKCSSAATTNWIMFDTTRNTYNYVGNGLVANSSNAEGSYYNYFDFLSNGFKARVSDSDTNANGSTYIYMAFAENPFKNSNAR